MLSRRACARGYSGRWNTGILEQDAIHPAENTQPYRAHSQIQGCSAVFGPTPSPRAHTARERRIAAHTDILRMRVSLPGYFCLSRLRETNDGFWIPATRTRRNDARSRVNVKSHACLPNPLLLPLKGIGSGSNQTVVEGCDITSNVVGRKRENARRPNSDVTFVSIVEKGASLNVLIRRKR